MNVRDDLASAHRLAWAHLAKPGSWWTGAQRVELAETARSAIGDDDPLLPWVAPSQAGRLAAVRCAPDVAHDAVYRISLHAGTITGAVHRRWADELGELPYVELCAIASTVAAVAHFCRNIGVDVPALPIPVDGARTGEQPPAIAPAALNWVPVAAPPDETAAVVQAYSAVPGEFTNTWRMADAQYMPADEMSQPDWTRRPAGLTRPQMELVAAKVAQLRECFY